MRVGKGIGEGKYNRCVFIRGNNNNKEGRDEEGMGDGNDFTTTTTPTPKVMILFYFSINIPASHSIITKTSPPSNAIP